MKVSRVFGLSVSALLFGASVWLYANRQGVLDWWRLRDYEPAPAIARLAADGSFSDSARRLFYVHDPELLDKSGFTGKCSNSEVTIVLGCYITHSKIYVFDVEDERLEGVEEVTAAHEMLHAAYDRLSEDEKEDLNKQLIEAFTNLNNDRLNRTIASYEARDPSIVPNELHSILATEIRDLPTELEEYYEQYFLDRLVIVGIAEAYEEEFTKRENQIAVYDAQLAKLNADIKQRETDIDFLNSSLSAEASQLEALRSDPPAYNAAIPSYNAKVREYNALLNTLRAKIDDYNDIVEKRNAIATEEQELVEALDTRATEL